MCGKAADVISAESSNFSQVPESPLTLVHTPNSTTPRIDGGFVPKEEELKMKQTEAGGLVIPVTCGLLYTLTISGIFCTYDTAVSNHH